MNTAVRKISVIAPARLHFGFLDAGGKGRRRFGSVGLALSAPRVSLSVERGPQLEISGEQAQAAWKHVEALQAHSGNPVKARVEIHEAIPEHAGLGSGTQLGIALGVAIARLHGWNLTVRDVAALVHRGGRSGIGIGAFEAGGFLVDGGRADAGEAPPIVARLAFPSGWRIVLVSDRSSQGLHGAEEVAAFEKLPDFPEAASAALCRLVLLNALPAVAEQDFDAFSESIGELQRVTGDHFAPAQGGRFSSPRVARVLDWFEGRGIRGVGQSSWGPTGFAVVRAAVEAERLLAELRRQPWLSADIGLSVCAGRNEGGAIDVAEPLRQPVFARARRG